MNGYSKISTGSGTGHKSRSIDLSDLLSSPHSRSQTPKASRKSVPIAEEPNSNKVRKPERELDGERFGVILGRSSSVCRSSGFELKRAFSMRRSSSVSERYCRIHDQYMATTSPVPIHMGDEEIDDGIVSTKSINKKNKGVKIFKVCKRLLGL